jgi:hypothetical protein
MAPKGLWPIYSKKHIHVEDKVVQNTEQNIKQRQENTANKTRNLQREKRKCRSKPSVTCCRLPPKTIHQKSVVFSICLCINTCNTNSPVICARQGVTSSPGSLTCGWCWLTRVGVRGCWGRKLVQLIKASRLYGINVAVYSCL